MNSLLNKFASVTIENTSRISVQDQEYCENQERMYKEALNAMLTAQIALKAVYNTYEKEDIKNYKIYLDDTHDIRYINNRMEVMKNIFIGRIFNHFSDTYKVNLNSSKLEEKYSFSVTYQQVIEEIFIQLGGFSFEERSIKELKDKSKSLVYNSDKIIIKNNKLTINDFIYWDSYSWEGKKIGWGDKKVQSLFIALSHFETDSIEMLNYYKSIYSELTKGEKHCDIFSKYEVNYNKVESLKIFKNGKVEIVFQNNQQAEQFKNEYLTK